MIPENINKKKFRLELWRLLKNGEVPPIIKPQIEEFKQQYDNDIKLPPPFNNI